MQDLVLVCGPLIQETQGSEAARLWGCRVEWEGAADASELLLQGAFSDLLVVLVGSFEYTKYNRTVCF